MSNYVTRSQVYHNGLDESIHRYTVQYSEDDLLTFVFSSELYMNIYKRKLEENRSKINESLSKRFGYEIENNKLADLKLYSATEKRGFYIIGKEEFKCLNNIKLDGANLIQRN